VTAVLLPSATADAHPVRVARLGRRRRVVTVCAALLAVAAVTFMAALAVGDFPLSVGDVFASLTGRGTRASDFIVYDLRLPRVLTGLLVGFSFGISGSLFQTMIKNPLASPDIIGITSGASASAVVAILVFGLSGFAVSAISFAGALATALFMYLLAWRNGVAGYRLVLVGIGVSAVLYAVIDFLMTTVQVFDAQVALLWLTGSLNGVSTSTATTLGLLLVLIVPLTLWASGALSGLQLGDDTAASIGIRVERSRLLLIILGVALAAVATAAAGPIGFAAFVSGPIARRLTSGASGLVPAGLVGACVVACSDFAGQHLLPFELPVGVLTAIIGAPYLLYLLVRSNRVGTGG
jgi:iron complex transport system permease protein